MKTILCYGDSNTWGAVPATGQRHPEDVRWTGILARELGAEYRIVEDGLSGRTTVWDDPFEGYRNGLASLGYSIHSTKPIDLVVVMLGSNDLNYTDAYGYYKGLGVITDRLLHAQVFYPARQSVFRGELKVLLVSPITLHPDVARLRPEIHLSDKYADSCQFAAYTRRLAEEKGVPWMDAAEFAEPSVLDCLHMDAESHRSLGEAIARKILTLFK